MKNINSLFPKSFCVNQSAFQQYSKGEIYLLFFYSYAKEEDKQDIYKNGNRPPEYH